MEKFWEIFFLKNIFLHHEALIVISSESLNPYKLIDFQFNFLY